MSLLTHYAALRRGQWLSRESLHEVQSAKLQRLIRHAHANVPFWRNLMDHAGLGPQDIRTPADLVHLPVTTKESMREQPPDDHVAVNIPNDRCVILKSSGSQGAPFEVRFTREDRSWWRLLALRGWLANKYRFGDRMLVIHDERQAPHGTLWFERLGMFRQRYTSLYTPAEEQADVAEHYRPDVIRGITSDVALLARTLQARGTCLVTPRLVLTSAELMDGATRRVIETGFGVSPSDFYGSIESGWIAWECPMHSGYHLNSDCLIVEFLRDGKPVAAGEPGEIYVTNLHSHAMPFIRYSVGDMGTPINGECTCGCRLPRMETVEGRTLDCITLPNGRLISPYRLTCTIEDVPGIDRYQILQKTHEHIDVSIIPNARFGSETTRLVTALLEALLEQQIRVNTIIVDRLTKDESGKFRVVCSEIGSRNAPD